MRALVLGALSAGWMASSWAAHRRFRAALENPAQSQERVLARVLAEARGSAYGRALGLGSVRSARDWQRAVPLIGHDELAPWIDRVLAGERGVLTASDVLMVETTAGSSAAEKFIPYTAGLRAEFGRALQAWMFDLYTRRPRLMTRATYWSVSPVARRREKTAGGLAIGFEDDTEYFGGVERFVMGQLMPVPAAVGRLSTIEDCRYATLRFLVAEPRLGLVSVWNPTFWTLLLDFFEAHREALLRDVHDGTLRLPGGGDGGLGGLVRADRERARALARGGAWSELQVISCWGSGAARGFLGELARRCPGVEIQRKGLLATEGVVTIPLWDVAAPVLAIESHFYEFRDDSGALFRAEEVEAGREYEVVLSTSGGLYRYRLGDRVRVEGFAGRTPLLELIGRARVSDLCGEKISEEQVTRALSAMGAVAFALVAPWMGSPPRYVLHVECAGDDAQVAQLGEAVEASLLANPHYAYCRRLGQLGPVGVFRITRGGAAAYLAQAEARGQRAGSVKYPSLERADSWDRCFEGRRIGGRW